MDNPDPLAIPLLLIAPNISERMGGEAIKALQIHQSLVARGFPVHQITHARVRDEMSRSFPDLKITYLEDDRLDRLFWRLKVFSFATSVYFMWRAARMARTMVKQRPGTIVHYTSPISPVVPMFPIPGAKVIVGPINGNIHHPPGFRDRESMVDRLRRWLVVPSQWLHRAFFSGKQTADVILVAGGERTYKALRIAGCRDEQFRESLDSGIPDALMDEPPIEQSGINYRFVQQGRLVPYKGTDLVIKAIARARLPVTLDVIGDGKERTRLERLAADLGVTDRVHFLGWRNHADLIPSLHQYRGMTAPSLAEANGIVFQEAMMIGLPIITVDWGGQALLVTSDTGFLIPPVNEERVIAGLAEQMDRLAEDGSLAQAVATRARNRAIDRGFVWSDLIEKWIAIYRGLVTESRPLSVGDRQEMSSEAAVATRQTDVDLFRQR